VTSGRPRVVGFFDCVAQASVRRHATDTATTQQPTGQQPTCNRTPCNRTPCNGRHATGHHATDAVQPDNVLHMHYGRRQAAGRPHPRRHLRPDYRGHCAHVHRMRAACASLAGKTALCFPTQRHRCGDPKAVRGMACSWRHCGDGQRSTRRRIHCWRWWRVACRYLGNVGMARLVLRCTAGRADQGAGSVLLDQRFRPRYAQSHLLKARPIPTYWERGRFPLTPLDSR
jgi:hypothetical protein